MNYDVLSPEGHALLEYQLGHLPTVTYGWWLWLPAEVELIGYAVIAAAAIPFVAGVYRVTHSFIHSVGSRIFPQHW